MTGTNSPKLMAQFVRNDWHSLQRNSGNIYATYALKKTFNKTYLFTN